MDKITARRYEIETKDEELETYIFNYINYEYPRLTLETIGDIAEMIFDGFEWWKEENLGIIESYIENKIELCTEEEFIEIREDLYQQAEEEFGNREIMIDYYTELLQDRECCVAWCGSQYTTSDIDNEETEDVWIYME